MGAPGPGADISTREPPDRTDHVKLVTDALSISVSWPVLCIVGVWTLSGGSVGVGVGDGMVESHWLTVAHNHKSAGCECRGSHSLCLQFQMTGL